MAHSYSHLYGLNITGLRLFTAYGPWGRPDMAPSLFAKGIIDGDVIKLFNNGEMSRDFTFVDDIVEGIIRVLDNPATANLKWNANSPDPSSSYVNYRIYNIGNSKSIKLMDFVKCIENAVGKKAKIKFLPMQDGDVLSTYADTSEIQSAVGFKPSTPLQKGIDAFIDWYREYYAK